MILDRVTVTGADNSIEPYDLIPITKRFPFVEWGILLSKNREGTARFPTIDWIKHLWEVKDHVAPLELKLSGHLCGRWVRDVCAGNWTFSTERPDTYALFQRIQLNFHAEVHRLNRQLFLKGILDNAPDRQFIFQIDNVNNSLLTEAIELGINASPLFDLSGGAGILPSSWPTTTQPYTGYAGGLSPDNVAEQLEKIKAVAGNARIWIDAERRLRSEDDSKLDLDKVVKFLENAEPYVTK